MCRKRIFEKNMLRIKKETERMNTFFNEKIEGQTTEIKHFERVIQNEREYLNAKLMEIEDPEVIY